MKNLNQLSKIVEKNIQDWEGQNFKVGKVGNLSLADMELIQIYIEQGGRGLRKPLGDIKTVLEEYGYTHPEY